MLTVGLLVLLTIILATIFTIIGFNRRSKKCTIKFGGKGQVRVDHVEVIVEPNWERPTTPLWINGSVRLKFYLEGEEVIREIKLDTAVYRSESYSKEITSFRNRFVKRYRLIITLMSSTAKLNSASELLVYLKRL